MAHLFHGTHRLLRCEAPGYASRYIPAAGLLSSPCTSDIPQALASHHLAYASCDRERSAGSARAHYLDLPSRPAATGGEPSRSRPSRYTHAPILTRHLHWLAVV